MSVAIKQRQWLQLHQIPRAQWLDQRWADPLGCLLLLKRIDEHQYNYGLRYRDTALAYRLTQGLSSGLPKLMGAKGLANFEVDHVIAEAIKARYLGYRRVILKEAGRRALQFVHTVCANERMDGVGEFDLPELIKGLVALRRWRGAKYVAIGDRPLASTNDHAYSRSKGRRKVFSSSPTPDVPPGRGGKSPADLSSSPDPPSNPPPRPTQPNSSCGQAGA